MASHLAKNNVDHDCAVGNRCPAGSHIQSEAATVPHAVGEAVASKSALKHFLSTDAPQSVEPGDTHYGHLTDLAYAAEHARIEARKNHKRFTDAIYARRRRQREKEDEKELVREAEHAHKVNKKLREENNKLQSMLSSAIAEVEAMGDTEKEWLRNVLEKAKAISVPPTQSMDESNDVNNSTSMKRQSKHVESTSVSTVHSVEVDSHLRSPCRKTEIESSQVEDTTATSASSRPLNAMNDSIATASAESRNRRDGNDIPLPTDKHAIEALQQASYLQGLQDAVLLNRQREIQNHPQQPRPLPVVPSTINEVDALQATVLNDPLNQRTIDQLLLMSRINALSRYPDSSVLHPELSSLLDPHSILRSGCNPASDLLFRNTSAIGYPINPAMISALAGLRNFNGPPVPSSPSLPSQLTAAQLLAINNSVNAYQAQMQLGLLNAYSDRTNVLTSLLQHHQLQEQQISLLTQLQQQEQQSPPPNSSSSSPAKSPQPNVPP